MRIKQDPVTKLWCRADGAVLLPPSGTKFKKFRWAFGSLGVHGYRLVGYKGKLHRVHQLICRAFHGIPPDDKPCVDHINRIRDDNRKDNLRYVDKKGNADNQAKVDEGLEKYGVRQCDDPKAYFRVYDAAKIAKKKAQGLRYCKGPGGKWGWYPRIRA